MRAQVSLFLLVGIVILVLAGLALFVFNSNQNIEKNLRIQEADEIRTLIKLCLEENSKEAIVLAGQNGGWLSATLPELDSDYRAVHSNYLRYQPGTIPYWYFIDENGYSRSLQPPLCKSSNCPINSFGALSVQEQIEQYTLVETVECVDLSAYDGRVDITTGLPGLATDIGGDAVIFRMKWPHTISVNGNTEDFEDIIVTQNVRLGDTYKTSDLIVKEERYGTHFSQQTLSMISLYNGLDQPIPPMASSDMSLFAPERIWVSESVKTHIKEEIIPLNQLFQVRGTSNYQAITDDSDNSIFVEGIYKGFDIGFTEEQDSVLENLEANIVVPNAEPEISINGGKSVIRGEKLIDGGVGILTNLLGIGFTRYSTTYSMSYPLVVSVRDPAAFNGEGFTFNTAFEVNIKNNQPARANFLEEDESSQLYTNSGISLTRYADNDLRILVKNELDGSGVEDIRVSYVCGQEYNLGKTDLEGELDVKMPLCDLGGRIKLFHPAYSSFEEAYDYDNEEEIEFSVWPIVNKEVKVSKSYIGLAGSGKLTVNTAPERREVNEETDYFMLILESNEEWPGPQVLTFGNDGSGLTSDLNALGSDVEELEGFTYPEEYNFSAGNNTIKITPGTYNITGILMHTQPFTLPEEEVCILGLFNCETKPSQTFNSWPKGGLKLTNFVITEEDVYEDNTWNFVFESIEHPEKWKQFESDARLLWKEEDQNDNNVGLIVE